MALFATTTSFVSFANSDEVNESPKRDTINGIPAEFIDQIRNSRQTATTFDLNEDSNINVDELLDQLSMLYMRKATLSEQASPSNYNKLLSDIESEISQTKMLLDKSGTILLTNEEVKMLQTYMTPKQGIPGYDEVRVPNDTSNTEYYLSPIYTVETDIGSLDYYYITATCQSTNSNMWTSKTINLPNFSIEDLKSASLDIIISRSIDAILEKISKKLSLIPWELIFPGSYGDSTYDDSTYTIKVSCATNVRFVFCYSESFQEYDLGVILNSTSVSETHIAEYVENGKAKQQVTQNEYYAKCKGYDSIRSTTKEYWESYRNQHFEKIDKIEYYYNGNKFSSVTPKFAYTIANLN